MSVKVEKISGCKVKLDFVLDSEVFDTAIDEAFNKKIVNIEVKGFRKGKVPREIFNQKFGEQSLYEDAMNIIINNEYIDAIKKKKIDAIGQPELDVDFATVGRGKKLKFSITTETWPEVELGQYKEIEVKLEDAVVTDEDVTEFIDKARKDAAELVLVEDGALENGHTAVFDFDGSVDGVPFEGGKAENYSLEIGSGQFFPGFEEQMVGMKSEEEKVLKVTFPESYPAKELSGKEADFKVKLHEIKKRVLPELNDEFVSELEIENVKTVEEYNKYALETLQKEKVEARENKFANEVLTKAIENATLEVPETLVSDEVNRSLNQYESQAKQFNIPLEQLLSLYGITDVEQYKQNIRPSAVMNVKQRAVFLKIAEVEKIKMSASDYKKELEEIVKTNGGTLEEAEQVYTKEIVTPYVQMGKVIDLIKKTAKII